MDNIITAICGGLIGFILSSTGITIFTWQFWAIMILMGIIIIF